jgi:RimJ/RimL family protein N-acetyltransferase
MLVTDFQKIFNAEDLRHVFIDKKGIKFIIRPADKRDYHLLLQMYDQFEPKRCAQGIPPCDPVIRKKLVKKIINESINVISETESIIVGHACLIDIEPGIRSELEIAVHQDWRNRGLGTAIMSLLVKIANRLNYKKIWLTVDNTNRMAIHIYQKYGFTFVGQFDSEREMELKIK